MNNIYLLGFSGVGKTSIGKLLAEKMNRTFYDLDEHIIKKIGMSIRLLFARFGESKFRIVESEALVEVSQHHNVLVATGGGIILDPQNWKVMNNTGITITLDIDLETFKKRIRTITKEHRPLYDNISDHKIESIYKQRKPLYAGASKVIAIDHLTNEKIITKVLSNL